MTPEQAQEVTRLRALNLSPKQIARQLKLRPAEVNTLIRMQAEAAASSRVARGELALLERCLINENAAQRILDLQPKKWLDKEEKDDFGGGLAQIFVTRLERNQYLLGSYLVDYWCLGVKDAFGPRKLDRVKYESLIRHSYATFEEGYREITLEQAQAIIFGAVDYAATLGLKPHPDFEQAKDHLGERIDNLPVLEFGRSGKPFYINGPYDNSDKIIATLRETVGDGNFDYLMSIGPDPGWEI